MPATRLKLHYASGNCMFGVLVNHSWEEELMTAFIGVCIVQAILVGTKHVPIRKCRMIGNHH